MNLIEAKYGNVKDGAGLYSKLMKLGQEYASDNWSVTYTPQVINDFPAKYAKELEFQSLKAELGTMKAERNDARIGFWILATCMVVLILLMAFGVLHH